MEKHITPYDAYEVHGCKDFGDYVEQVPDAEAQFWSLYGHIPGQGLDCIGDYTSRQAAEEVRERITAASLLPEIHAVLEEADNVGWVHNVAITGDIEALRRICLAYCGWWNHMALPLIGKLCR